MRLMFFLKKDASGFTKKAYTRALGFPGGIGGLISMKRYQPEEDDEDEDSDAKVYYYHYDALGSVRGLSNEKGKLKAEFDYDAFGNGRNNKEWNTYRFSSKEFEDHAGLYYFGARYYDPETGRWLTPDPLGFIDGPNKYLYVANNPVNFIDPWGLLGEKKLSALEWWLYESVVPGPFGAPVSEWQIGRSGSIFWGDPMRYTEEAGGTVMWLERGAVGIGAVAVVTATSLITYEATTAIRIEFHMPHAEGPHQYPHLQGIQGPGWGKTIWRWPNSYPRWRPKP
jgi:RHS repeat-associated protein